MFLDTLGILSRWIGLEKIIEYFCDRERATRHSQKLVSDGNPFRQFMENAPQVVWIQDLYSQRLIYISPAYEMVWGQTRRSFYGAPLSWMDAIHPDDLDGVRAKFQAQAIQPQTSQEWGEATQEYRIIQPNGQVRYIRDRRFPIRDSNGAVYQLGCIAEDITEEKTTEALRGKVLSEVRFQAIFEQAIVGLAQLSHTGEIMYFNQRYSELLGYSASELIHQNHLKFIHPDDVNTVKNCITRVQDWITQVEVSQPQNHVVEVRYLRKDGQVRWISLTLSRLAPEESGPPSFLAAVEDISQRRQTQEKLIRSAWYDTLTDLPNRAFFINRLEVALRDINRRPSQQAALLFIDLDRFKAVNDRLGHLAGDQLLVEVAQRLQQVCVHDSETGPQHTLARLGGDEFAILLVNIQTQAEAIAVAEQIQAQFRQLFQLHNLNFSIGASIGIALSQNQAMTHPYEQVESWIRDADTAMYQAKNEGKAGWVIFDPSRHDPITHPFSEL